MPSSGISLSPLDLSRFFEQHPVLETERLLLRPVTLDDKDAIFDYASDPEVTKYMLFNTHTSIADVMAFYDWLKTSWENRERIEFGMELKLAKELIGVCGLHQLSADDQSVELGYVLRRTYWGKGYMSEAVRELMRFSFEEMGMYRVQAFCFAENERSARVMERCGMMCEGTLRDHRIVRNEYVSQKLYSILRPEWESNSGRGL